MNGTSSPRWHMFFCTAKAVMDCYLIFLKKTNLFPILKANSNVQNDTFYQKIPGSILSAMIAKSQSSERRCFRMGEHFLSNMLHRCWKLKYVDLQNCLIDMSKSAKSREVDTDEYKSQNMSLKQDKALADLFIVIPFLYAALDCCLWSLIRNEQQLRSPSKNFKYFSVLMKYDKSLI